MAQAGAMLNIIKTKIEFVKSQARELYGLLDTLVNKETESIDVNIDFENQRLNKIRETNSRLDIVLEFLLGRCADINNFIHGLPVDHKENQQCDGSLSASSPSSVPQELKEVHLMGEDSSKMGKLTFTQNQSKAWYTTHAQSIGDCADLMTANFDEGKSQCEVMDSHARCMFRATGLYPLSVISDELIASIQT